MSGLFQALRHLVPGALPQFIVVGARNSGTTSLYATLTAHPMVRPASKKEVHFFDYGYERGVRWYRGHFPRANSLQGGAITGEVSPYYLFHPYAPARIRNLLPGVKLIAILRDPVDRAISHFFHERRRGREPLGIEEAMDREEERLAPEIRRMREDGGYHSRPHLYWSYKARGLYAEQLQRYLDLFPREQLLVLQSEDFFKRRQEVMHRTFRFLGVPPMDTPVPQLHLHRGSYDSSDVPAGVRENLIRFFRPHNDRLYSLLSEDFGWKR